MNHDIHFAALGGGQSVGASCYYLGLGNSHILLDCGTGISKGIVFEPDMYPLLSRYLESLGQIGQIFVSHAHNDHVGYLPKLLNQAGNVPVYMTNVTEVLTEYQLYDKQIQKYGEQIRENHRLAIRSMLEKVIPVTYYKPMNFGTYRAAFYPAGHIPGAMMMLFEYNRKKILYTGDFSLHDTPLTAACMLPESLKIDIMILCGLHAKHPNGPKAESHKIEQTLIMVFDALRRGRSVYCKMKQLSKGMEFLKILNEWNEQKWQPYKIYLEDTVLDVLNKMEQMNVPLYSEYNYSIRQMETDRPHIVLGSKNLESVCDSYKKINVDFSLHVTFDELIAFVKKINPKQAIVVHCAEKQAEDDITIEQKLMCDAECRTQFIFAEEKEFYTL